MSCKPGVYTAVCIHCAWQTPTHWRNDWTVFKKRKSDKILRLVFLCPGAEIVYVPRSCWSKKRPETLPGKSMCTHNCDSPSLCLSLTVPVDPGSSKGDRFKPLELQRGCLRWKDTQAGERWLAFCYTFKKTTETQCTHFQWAPCVKEVGELNVFNVEPQSAHFKCTWSHSIWGYLEPPHRPPPLRHCLNATLQTQSTYSDT